MARKKKVTNQRADKGTGSYRQKENGKYEYRVTYKDYDGNSRRKTFTAYTLTECYEMCDEFLRGLEKVNYSVRNDATIPDLVETHLQRKLDMNYMQPQGFHRSMETLQIIKRSFLGSLPIQIIEKEHLHRFLRSITTYADSTIEKIFLQLKIAYRMAVSKKIIDTNLMMDDEIVRPRSKKETKEIVSFTQDEQKIFLETLHAHKVPAFRNNYKRQLLLELNTGMRMGEINALKKEDIDFRRKVIKVKRTISLGEKSRPFLNDTTKTDSGRREIPFTEETEKLLREVVADSKSNPEGLLFYDHLKMGLITTNQVNSFFNRICEKADLDIRGQHSLRHTFATRCIEAGIEPVVLKKWMGHTDIHVTLDTYADVFDSMHNSSISKLGDHMTTINE